MDLARFDLPRYLSMLPLFQDMGPPELQRLAQVPDCGDGAAATTCRVGEPCTNSM